MTEVGFDVGNSDAPSNYQSEWRRSDVAQRFYARQTMQKANAKCADGGHAETLKPRGIRVPQPSPSEGKNYNYEAHEHCSEG